MAELEGRTAVVTGGSTGIGLAAAVRLAGEGAYVFLTGRREPELETAVARIGADRATAVRGDVSDLADLDRLYDAVRAQGRGLAGNQLAASMDTDRAVFAVLPVVEPAEGAASSSSVSPPRGVALCGT